jgi:hypothetical protein
VVAAAGIADHALRELGWQPVTGGPAPRPVGEVFAAMRREMRRQGVDPARPVPEQPAKLSPPAEVLRAMFPWLDRQAVREWAERLAEEADGVE